MDRPAVRWVVFIVIVVLVASSASLATRRFMQPGPPAPLWLDTDGLAAATPLAAGAHPTATDGLALTLPIGTAGPLTAGQRVDIRTIDGVPVAKALPVLSADATTVTLEVEPAQADLLDAASTLVVVAPWRDTP